MPGKTITVDLDTIGSPSVGQQQTTVGNGQVLTILGGHSNDVVVLAGGVEAVASGGTASGTTISGGKLLLSAGASLGVGAVAFSGTGGMLQIGGTTMPTNVVSGLAIGDTIDLSDVDFGHGGSVQLRTGNVLEVVANGNTYDLKLDPNQNFSSKSFRLYSDGHGGTNVTEANGLSINITYDTSVDSASPGFRSAINYVVGLYEGLFSNAATINIDVGYGEEGGTQLPSGVHGQSSQAYDESPNYDPIRAELVAENAPGAAFLPAIAPAGLTLDVGPAQEKGRWASFRRRLPSHPFDGYVGIRHERHRELVVHSGRHAWPRTATYFVGVAEHEILGGDGAHVRRRAPRPSITLDGLCFGTRRLAALQGGTGSAVLLLDRRRRQRRATSGTTLRQGDAARRPGRLGLERRHRCLRLPQPAGCIRRR